ncbi:polyphosphate polymerase domain-containing protein [Heyndrickxia sp. FSL K6-6286]|uniref:polyphosphate polymerase domain-containing protein n=1 Tax=Heyndrickxia sp. FSL K6-6286 TaxID=2921510 RepID=UPI0003A09C10
MIKHAKGRSELKYAVTKADCHLLRRNLQFVMQPDPHVMKDGKYLIRSVYFDNLENKALNQKKEGLKHRDKYRARLYNYKTDFIQLEKKSKQNDITYKEKCQMTAMEYERVRLGDIKWMENNSRKLIRELYVQMTLYQIKPTTVVDYEREVFTYEYGNVRVTFDSEVRTSLRNIDFLNPELPMVPALDPNIVILEVKYDEFLPDIIKQLLQIGDTMRTSSSKYQLSRNYV